MHCAIPRAVLAAALFALPIAASSQAFPVKPVRLIVPTPAGGAVDQVARLVGQKISEALGQPAVVDNRPNTVVAAEAVARAAPDGYTLLVANSTTHISNLFLIRNLPYDPVKDFTPIILAIDTVTALVAHPSVKANSTKELIELARANPGKVTYGSSGTGSAFHVAGEVFKSMAAIDMVHVPYKGLAPAMSDLAGGQIATAFTALSLALPFSKSAKVKLLAIADSKRYRGLPDVPALAEAVPGYEKPATWTAFVGPSGMPQPIVARGGRARGRGRHARAVRGHPAARHRKLPQDRKGDRSQA
jgi:tripartite-type tricarboxylate transporter receptor subunit TctC